MSKKPNKILELKKIARNVSRFSNGSFGMCLYLSAILANEINTKTKLEAKVAVGSFGLFEKLIFVYHPINDVIDIALNSNETKTLNCDGHAWVEVKGLIIDPSIVSSFSVAYPGAIIDNILKDASNGEEFLFDSSHNLSKKGLRYFKEDELSSTSINYFLKISERIMAS